METSAYEHTNILENEKLSGFELTMKPRKCFILSNKYICKEMCQDKSLLVQVLYLQLFKIRRVRQVTE